MALIVALSSACGNAQQAQFTRLDTPPGNIATASAGADAGSNGGGDMHNDQNEVLADAGATVTAADTLAPGTASATSVGAATAMALTPVGASILLPTGHSAVIQSQIVDSAVPKRARTFEGTGAGANSTSSYQLNGDAVMGFLRGSVYVVGLVNGSMSGSGLIGGSASVQSQVNGFGVQANYNSVSGLWSVRITMPDSTMNFDTLGVNQYVTFVVPVSLPTNVGITSSSNSTIALRTLDSSDGHAQVQVTLAASAWAQFTPTMAPPPRGDFDGDGDVDGAEFLALQRGIGENLAASLSQGDANHDGIVDAMDVQEFNDSFGASLTASAVATPEPAALALAVIGLLYAGCAVRHRNHAV